MASSYSSESSIVEQGRLSLLHRVRTRTRPHGGIVAIAIEVVEGSCQLDLHF